MTSAFLVFPSTTAFAEDINSRKLYADHCARCHGDDGAGKGPASSMQRPWPRDFTTGQYKFRSTPLNTLPTRKDVIRIIAKGNHRTSMPGFEKFLKPEEIAALADYVLHLSSEKSPIKTQGQPIPYPEEMNSGTPVAEQLRRGEEVFKGQCVTCHGDNGRGLGPLSGFLRDPDNFWAPTADLTDPAAYAGGSKPADVYMRLKTGIALSRMPSYADVLTDEQIRDVSFYVRSLQVPPQNRTLVSKTEWNEALPADVRGEYMVRAMSCALCHNSYDGRGYYYPDLYLAGGVGITLPGLGVFYTRNITSDPEHGVGAWTEEQIVRTLTTGYAPDRRLEAFAMPWVFFSHLAPEDAQDIAAYLKNLQPIKNKVPERKYFSFWKRITTRIRQLMGKEYGRLEYPPYNQGDAKSTFGEPRVDNEAAS